MQFSLESLAALATIVGVAVSLLALVQDRAWLILTSLVIAILAMSAGLYARRGRLALNAASTVIEGRSIDSLNIANLRRQVNRTFVIQDACHEARITGEDLEITWKYSGYCKADRESAIEFSMNSDASTPFDRLECVAFDLGHDPHMRHSIRPTLVGPEGISKRISVTFLEPLRANQSFSVLLKCTLPGCIKAGFGYYTSTLAFAQKSIRRSEVKLTFVGTSPSWMRVYESTTKHPAQLVKTLPPHRRELTFCEYADIIADRDGQSTRVYAFWRETL